MAATDYATVDELVDAMFSAETAAEFTKLAADASEWKRLHSADTAMLTTAWEAFEMRRNALFPEKR